MRITLFVLNSCGVLEKSERKVLKRAREFKKRGKKVIIVGCLPLISLKTCEKLADGMLGPKSIIHASEVAKNALEGKKTLMIRNERDETICLTRRVLGK